MKRILNKLTRKERGQALVIVLCLLALGGLVIVPLLNHMYTGLSTGKIYWEKVPLSYAAEAGLEDGIWKSDNDEVPLSPYDYVSEHIYSLPENINDSAVEVRIKQVWPLAGLESDVNGTIPATGLRITGGIVNAEGRYEARLSYDFPETELLVDKIAVWLPPDFEYVTNSASIITTENPTELDWNGGKILTWEFDPPVNFLDLPGIDEEDPIEGGFQPAVQYPTIKILRFNVTPAGEVTNGSYSWVRTTNPAKYLSWESGITIYKISSIATDTTTDKSIMVNGYTYTSEGIDTGWLDTGGSLFTGDYRAIGNTLMENNDGDRSREVLLSESSATIHDIPPESETAFAYLYWSGWRDYSGTMTADTTCTFRIETPDETLRPNASGTHTECDAVGDSPNYLCVDEEVTDDDSTYVKTGYEIGILRPDASGTHTECEPVGDSPNYECVDETTTDEDSTCVQTGYAPEVLRPNASGTYTQCDPIGDSYNYRCVDEATADGDSTYVRTWYGDTGMDTYNIANHSVGTGTINSVTVYIRTAGTSSGHTAQTVLRTNSTNYYGTNTSIPTSYTDLSSTYTTNPYTTNAWTWSEIDALQIGVRQYDLNGGYLKTTQVWAEVSYGTVEEQTTILRPNDAGDETGITYQEPSSGAHWDKVDEETADDFSTYVYTTDTPTPPSDWYNLSWQFRKKITIDHNQVETDLTDFPVLISITDIDLRDHAKSDGSDIVFTSSDGTTKLKREIERYTSSSGALVAWVKADLSSTADTVIYLYYGNPAASETNDTDTWDTSFKGVWHLAETSGNANDSTSYGTGGTISGTVTRGSTGKIDGAYDFGSSGRVNIGDPADGHLDAGTGGWTVSWWMNVDRHRWAWENPFNKGGVDNYGRGYGCEVSDSSYTILWTINDGTRDWGWSTDGSFTLDTWQYWVGVVDRGSSRLRLYKNGSQVDYTSISGVGSLSGTASLTISASNNLDGLIDEYRVSNTNRSAGWIETSYNNQSNPSNFYSIEDEELPAGAYERDLYNVADYSAEAAITGVTVYFRFSGDHVGVNDYTGYARAAIKTNGTVYLGSAESQTGKTFVTKSSTWTTNPFTGYPWTWDEVAALQAGVELSGTSTTQAYCTQVYAEISYTPSETEIDTYSIQNMTGTGTINSVTVRVRSRGTSIADTHAVQPVLRTHDADYFGTYTLLSTSYTGSSTTYTTNPNTGSAWTWDEIDALEAGVKHYDNGDGSVRTTQVYVEIDYGIQFGEAQIDTYNLYDHAGSGGTISSVTVHIRSKGTSIADTHAIETVIRTHDTDYFGTYTLLPTSYTYLSTTYTTNPNTGSAWTWSEINALEAGIKHYDMGAGSVRTTQVYVEIDCANFVEEEITADTWWLVENASPDYSYSCFKDVTDLVHTYCPRGNATYTVGSVYGDTRTEWSYAGWSLIIIYSSPYEQGHQFFLWDQMMFAGTNDSGSFAIEGFYAPADASATLTCFVAEGDDWYDGDSLRFNDYYLSDETNPEDDVWNGKSSGLEGEIIDGMDIDTFDVSSPIISEGNTSATVYFTTTQDNWNLLYLILAFRSDLAVLTPSSTGILSYGFGGG